EPFVWAEGLKLYWSEGGLVDIDAQDVPARREAGLEEGERPRGVGDSAVMMADHEVTRGLANVDAVVVVSGMACDSFVFLVESIHGLPGERYPSLQLARVCGQTRVLPRPSRRDVLARPDRIPGREPEVGVPGGMVGAFQRVQRDLGLREIRDRVAARFEEQEDLLAIGDPGSPEAHAHAPTQRLDVQQSLGQRFGHEKPADRSR